MPFLCKNASCLNIYAVIDADVCCCRDGRVLPNTPGIDKFCLARSITMLPFHTLKRRVFYAHHWTSYKVNLKLGWPSPRLLFSPSGNSSR